jgi:hypothetical protein
MKTCGPVRKSLVGIYLARKLLCKSFGRGHLGANENLKIFN